MSMKLNWSFVNKDCCGLSFDVFEEQLSVYRVHPWLL